MVFWPYRQPTQMRSCWDPGNWGPGGPVYLQRAGSEREADRSIKRGMLAAVAVEHAVNRLHTRLLIGRATGNRMAITSANRVFKRY